MGSESKAYEMTPGFKPPESASAKCALKYFGVAFVFLIAGVVTLGLNSSHLAAGQFLSSQVVGGLHLITLGWLTLSIFGALQVFIGVALGSQPFGKRLSSWILGAWALGTILFPLGLAINMKFLLVPGVLLLGAALLLFSIQLLPALWSAKRGQLTRYYTVLAIVSLWSIWILGGCAAFVRTGVHSFALPPGYFSAHILIAIFGWVGAMVAGVGSHLIPMFALSRETAQWPVRLALPFWALIPTAGLLSAFFPDPWTRAGWSAAAVVSILWTLQVALFMSSRIRREKDDGLLLAVVATAFLPIAWGVLLISEKSPVFIALLIFGWLMLFTLGIYHRVVPFLVWFIRFSRGMGQWRLPKVKDLLNERLSTATALLGVSGIAVWAFGLGSSDVVLLFAGAGTLLLSCLCAAMQVHFLTRDFSKGKEP